jgi:hypothetical protein
MSWFNFLSSTSQTQLTQTAFSTTISGLSGGGGRGACMLAQREAATARKAIRVILPTVTMNSLAAERPNQAHPAGSMNRYVS